MLPPPAVLMHTCGVTAALPRFTGLRLLPPGSLPHYTHHYGGSVLPAHTRIHHATTPAFYHRSRAPLPFWFGSMRLQFTTCWFYHRCRGLDHVIPVNLPALPLRSTPPAVLRLRLLPLPRAFTLPTTHCLDYRLHLVTTVPRLPDFVTVLHHGYTWNFTLRSGYHGYRYRSAPPPPPTDAILLRDTLPGYLPRWSHHCYFLITAVWLEYHYYLFVLVLWPAVLDSAVYRCRHLHRGYVLPACVYTCLRFLRLPQFCLITTHLPDTVITGLPAFCRSSAFYRLPACRF